MRFLALIVLFLAYLACCSSKIALPSKEVLPSISDIKSMKASFHDIEHNSGRAVEFDVPSDHWEMVIGALRPATRDNNAKKWEGIGELQIAKSWDGSIRIWLFRTDAPGKAALGAFAIGRDWEHRIYYRGGDSAALERALRAAHKAWNKEYEE